MNFRYSIFKWSIPITKFLGKAHAPWSHKKMTGKHLADVMNQIQPGDVLLSRTEGEFSNFLNPGYWKHAAIYFGGPNQVVIEAVGEGVRIAYLPEFILKKDAISICRAKFMTSTQAQQASNLAMMAVGEPYDFYFMPSNKAWYCSELVFDCIERAVPNVIPFEKRKTLGVDTVIPTDFWRARKKFDIVWASIKWSDEL